MKILLFILNLVARIARQALQNVISTFNNTSSFHKHFQKSLNVVEELALPLSPLSMNFKPTWYANVHSEFPIRDVMPNSNIIRHGSSQRNIKCDLTISSIKNMFNQIRLPRVCLMINKVLYPQSLTEKSIMWSDLKIKRHREPSITPYLNALLITNPLPQTLRQ